MTSNHDNKRFLKVYTTDKGVFRPSVIQLDNVNYINSAAPLTCSQTKRKLPAVYVLFKGDNRALLVAVDPSEQSFLDAFLV